MTLLNSILSQLFYLFSCILIGYILRKRNTLPSNATTVISRLESFVVMPCMILNNFMKNCTLDNLKGNSTLLLYGFFFMVIQTILAYLLLPLFTKDEQEKGIYRYSLAVVNFGFMGNSLVSGIYGEEMLFKYLIFTIPSLMLIYSLGVMWLKPGNSKFSFKMLFSPMFIYMLIGMILAVLQVRLPVFITKTISSTAACYSPLAMILTGLTVGSYDLKELLANKKVYALTLVRCIILPLIYLSVAKAVNLDHTVMILMAFITAMPLGLNPIVLPASYGADTRPGAAMAVISNLIGLVSVPVLLSLFL